MKTAITTACGQLGYLLAGIYRCARKGAFDIPSDFVKVCDREHQNLKQMAEEFKPKTKQ